MNKMVRIRIGTLEASVSEQDAKDLQRIFGASVVQQELTSLPDKWYTDGTAEANEWGAAMREGFCQEWKFVAPHSLGATGHDDEAYCIGTYITPTQFNEWVYKPWKESLKPKAPTTIEEVFEAVKPEWCIIQKDVFHCPDAYKDTEQTPTRAHAKSVLALCQLYNVAKCLNECFEGDCAQGECLYVAKDGNVYRANQNYADQCVIRFTSLSAAQHAADHFWHLFADFYMLENKQ